VKDGGPATIYTYDANGSRAGPGWGETDGQDRLPSSPVASAYTYTADGTLRTKTAGGQVTTYGYDLIGNLRSVQRPAPAAPISYGIDGLNRRVSKSVGGVLQRAWAWDGARIVAELDGAGNMTSRFVYGTRSQVPDYMIKGGQVYRLLTDHLGSVRLVVRLSDGAIAQELAYDPWGAVAKDTSPGLQPFGFAGGVYDPDTQLVRFGARDYDPVIGRWTAKDPSGFAGGTNLYAYAEDDPVNLVDLTGEHPVVFLMLAGAMEGSCGDRAMTMRMNMISESAFYSATIYFSYSQFFVFDKSVRRPGCAWTEGHSEQGFARREKNVSFGTLLEFGHAEVSVHRGPYKGNDEHERVIEVPIEVSSGEVVIGGPEELENKHVLRLPKGHYRLVAAQMLTDDDHEAIDLYVEKLTEPLTHSRIIVADDALHPPSLLLETVEVA
jgi:RHS repeat-associated protein